MRDGAILYKELWQGSTHLCSLSFKEKTRVRNQDDVLECGSEVEYLPPCILKAFSWMLSTTDVILSNAK